MTIAVVYITAMVIHVEEIILEAKNVARHTKWFRLVKMNWETCSSERVLKITPLATVDTLSHKLVKMTLATGRSPLPGACNSHTKPMSRRFYRPVYFKNSF